jgi:hypothetical protein
MKIALLLAGGGGLVDVTPSSGTLYSAAADGTYTLSVSQPGSPEALTRIELWVRVQSASGNMLQDGWLIRLESQVDGTWDVRAGSVASGTESFTVDAEDIGTGVTALKWVLDDNTLTPYYTTAGGDTKIGDITSATYQSETQVGASYTGATGSANPNADFSAWTGDDPDSWAVLGGETVDSFVTESTSPAGMRFKCIDGETTRLVQGSVLTQDVEVLLEISCVAFTGAANVDEQTGGSPNIAISAVGDTAYRFVPIAGGNLRLARGGGDSDLTLDLLRVRDIGVPADEASVITQLVQS